MHHHPFALALVVLAVSMPAERQGLNVVPIVGHWQHHSEGGEPIVTVDARRWDKKPVADPAAIARQLFKTPGAQFVANASSPEAFQVAAVLGVENFAGGKARVQFKMIAGPSDHIAGLMFNLRPSGEYHVVRYNTKEGNVALWKYADGARARVAGGTDRAQLALDVWHTLELQTSGHALTAVVNDQLRVQHTLPEPVAGRVGFWAKRDSVTAFKALRIE